MPEIRERNLSMKKDEEAMSTPVGEQNKTLNFSSSCLVGCVHIERLMDINIMRRRRYNKSVSCVAKDYSSCGLRSA